VAGKGQLPEGFYADKAADDKARGVAVKKRSLEEEMADFQASVAEDLRTAEEAEQEETERMAREKEEREAYEHEYVDYLKLARAHTHTHTHTHTHAHTHTHTHTRTRVRVYGEDIHILEEDTRSHTLSLTHT
jgi:hypothetical protein